MLILALLPNSIGLMSKGKLAANKTPYSSFEP